jgi:ribosomal protein S27AE
MTVKLRGCSKCGGDLFLGSDLDGRYFECLQCGYAPSLRVQPIRERQFSGEHKEPPFAALIKGGDENITLSGMYGNSGIPDRGKEQPVIIGSARDKLPGSAIIFESIQRGG